MRPDKEASSAASSNTIYAVGLTFWLVATSTLTVTQIFVLAAGYFLISFSTNLTALRNTLHVSWPLVLLCLWGGLIGFSNHPFNLWNYSRDFIYLAKVPFLIYVATQLTLKINDISLTLRAIFYAALILSAWYLVDYVLQAGWMMERRQLRITVGRGYFLGFFGVMVAIFANRYIAKYPLNRLLLGLFGTFLMVAASFASTSRGILLCPVFFGLAYLVFKAHLPFKPILFIGMVLVAFLSMPTNFGALEDMTYQLGNQGLHEMFATDFGSMQQIRAAFRSYEAHIALDQFLKFGVLAKVFGLGFGAVIELGAFVKLGISANTQELTRAVPITHISLMTALIKFGLAGAVLYMYSLLPMTLSGRPRDHTARFLMLINQTSVLLCLFVIWTFQGYFSNLDINNIAVTMIAITQALYSMQRSDPNV